MSFVYIYNEHGREWLTSLFHCVLFLKENINFKILIWQSKFINQQVDEVTKIFIELEPHSSGDYFMVNNNNN